MTTQRHLSCRSEPAQSKVAADLEGVMPLCHRVVRMLGRMTGGKARPGGVSTCDFIGEICAGWMLGVPFVM